MINHSQRLLLIPISFYNNSHVKIIREYKSGYRSFRKRTVSALHHLLLSELFLHAQLFVFKASGAKSNEMACRPAALAMGQALRSTICTSSWS
jgi:acetylornithine/succinyldiaminopimelate/putrescine aminotransferase